MLVVTVISGVGELLESYLCSKIEQGNHKQLLEKMELMQNFIIANMHN